MMGRALRVIAIESTASSTAPIEFKIPAGSYLQIGDAAPDISMKTLDGKPFQLSALRGHWVVVQFWATWCPPCVEELPTLQKIHRQFPKIEMVGVSFDEDAADAKHLIAEKGYDWTQLYLGAMETPLTRQWGIEVVPALYLIDPKGKIAGSAVTPDELIKLLPKE
jgi:peroxiredoxin